jgi:hypothetical protein
MDAFEIPFENVNGKTLIRIKNTCMPLYLHPV